MHKQRAAVILWRNTYATGGNENTASNAGINTQRTTIINFVICSLCAAARRHSVCV